MRRPTSRPSWHPVPSLSAGLSGGRQHRLWVLLASVVALCSPPTTAQTGQRHVLADMEGEATKWQGASVDASDAHEGQQSLLWRPTEVPELQFAPPLQDWSSFNELHMCFQAPPEAMGSLITVFLSSDDPGTGTAPSVPI